MHELPTSGNRLLVAGAIGRLAETLVDFARAAAVIDGPAAAEPILRRALAMQREVLVPAHRDLVPTLTILARLIATTEGSAESLRMLTEAVSIARAKLPERHSLRIHAETALRAMEGA